MLEMLVVLLIVAAVAACANWWSVATGNTRVETISKPAATIAIGAMAVAAAERGGVDDGVIVAAVVAYLCCLVGDVALLAVVDKFVVGLGAFLVGHLAFVVMFALLGLDEWWLGAVAAVGAVTVAVVVGRRVVAGARSEDPALVGPVCAYLVVILSMAIVGWATGRPAALIGTALFVASDSVLGWRKFVEARSWMNVTIMVTYHLALAGIALSLL